MKKNLPLILLILTAVILRTKPLFSEFWLDEIWSFNFSTAANNFFDIFFKFKHDNNHILNTVYMFLLGNLNDWVWYRGFSFVTGILTILFIYLFYKNKNQGNSAFLCAILVTFTSLHILYSTEARGYAPMLFFVIFSMYILNKYFQTKKLSCVVLFNSSVILGILSHFTYLHFIFGLSVYSIIFLYERNKKLSYIIKEISLLFGAPALFTIFIYLAFFKSMSIGGGPNYTILEVAAQILNEFLGFDTHVLILVIIFFVFMVLTILAILELIAEKKYPDLALYSISIFISPILVAFVLKPETIFVRYFLISLFMFIFFVSEYLLKIYRNSGPPVKIICIFIFVVFVSGNLYRTYFLWKDGRGDYINALKYIEINSSKEPITVASDFDFRNLTVINYYSKYIKKKVLYILQENISETNIPEWYLIHDFGGTIRDNYKKPLEIPGPSGTRFTLLKIFKSSGVDGWDWYLYKLQNIK